MDDVEVEDIIYDVWERIRPKLEADPAELARRLARRSSASMRKAPWAWCWAVRANDQRINPTTASMLGVGGLDPRRNLGYVKKHEVTLDAQLVRMLCAPVTIPRGGLPGCEVARLLGRFTEDLITARLKGTFSVRHVPPVGGRGRPVPVLSAKGELNPSVRGFEMPDRAWGCTAGYHEPWISDGFEQSVHRVPYYEDRTRRFRDKSNLHPEHPDVDRPCGAQKSRRLPPPAPDYVWYKWKEDEYIGYDWRAAEINPLIKEHYERHERRKAQLRAYAKARGPRPSQAKGSAWFRGWRWECPACGKAVKMLFLPRARCSVLDGLLGDVIEEAAKRRPLPVREHAGFACANCHGVRPLSRAMPGFWNAVILYLSGGLLYGYEVPRPAWLTKDRKRKYSPKVRSQPAWRREQVLELLPRGWRHKRIAAELGMSWRTVTCHARKIYAQHGVHGRDELARKLGVKLLPRQPGRASSSQFAGFAGKIR